MKDFDKYFDFIKDEETRSVLRKISDKASYVNKNYAPAVTEFTNPYIAELCMPIIKNYDIKFKLFPSFEHGERKVFILYPDFLEMVDENEFITGIRIHNGSKFKTLNHKDYLGSLMSIGIDRNKTGDIYVYDEYADIVMHADISDYIMYNLEKIGHNKINIEKIKINDVHYKEQEHTVINITSSSMRIDNIVKHITKKSRETASEIVRAGNVKVNWQVQEKVSEEVKENDMISISKYGRYKISKLSGLTKSGKFKVEIKHYV